MQQVTCSECKKAMSVTDFSQHDCYLRAQAEQDKKEVESYLRWEALKEEDERQPPLPFGLKRSTKIFPDAAPWLWVAGIVFVVWFLWAISHPGQARVAPSDCDIATACTDSR